jgi:hypothetical protein
MLLQELLLNQHTHLLEFGEEQLVLELQTCALVHCLLEEKTGWVNNQQTIHNTQYTIGQNG